MPNVANAAVGSSLTAVPILARMAVKPYAKKPYKRAKRIKGPNPWLRPQEVKDATAATEVQRIIKRLRLILSERMPKVH